MREWWRDAVIYQIYPRSFQDDNGDGIGDLPGITRRLDHVASLGADAIWLSPFFTSPDRDMGYDVSDYTGVNPLFGTIEDFDALVARAHELGLKVIIDQVLSHSSIEHPWFEESRQDKTNPKADWYIWADPKPDGTPPNNWPSVFGGSAWTFDARRRQYYMHNFLIEQPDLNFHNPEVVDTLLDTMEFWLERGVDGFRLDTVNFYVHDQKLRDNPAAEFGEMPFNPYEAQNHLFSKTRPENIDVLKKMRTLTDKYDARMMVGEVGEAGRMIDIMADYTSGGDKLHMAYSFEFLGPQYTPDHFRDRITRFMERAPDGWPCWSFSNHDVPRHATRWTPKGVDSDVIAKQAINLLISFPGTLGLYQGEELGQTETDILFEELTDLGYVDFWPAIKGRDGCRTPMVWDKSAANAGFSTADKTWLPVKAPQAARAVSGQDATNDSVLNTYRAALAFRKATPALSLGSTRFPKVADPVLAVERRHDDQVVTAFYNFSDKAISVKAQGAYDIAGPSTGIKNGDKIDLPPYGYVFAVSADTLTIA